MSIRSSLKPALIGLLALALVPGLAMASPAALSSETAARAASVSGPIISVTPLSHDFGRVNIFTCSTPFDFVISNTGDADLTIYTFNTVGDFTAGVDAFEIVPGGTAHATVSFCPLAGGAHNETLEITSNAANDPHVFLLVSGMGNNPPSLDPIGNKTGFAFVNLAFDVVGNDPNGDPLTYSSTALPPGATFNTNTGHFDWTPGGADAGVYTITFCASDGLADACETIAITITAGNHPPIADPGGPYFGATGQPISFDGTASSDPDGNALAYLWDFGDGGSATSAVASHTYSIGGSYLVTLTVTDDGTPPLSNAAATSATVVNLIPAQVTMKLPNSGGFRVSGGGNQLVGIETTAIPATAIVPSSVKMSTTYPNAGTVSEIAPNAAKGSSIGDLDGDNVPELVVTFSRTNITDLLGNVPNNTNIELVVTAISTAGVPIRGTIVVRVKSGGPAAVSAYAAPNPFNPQTKVSYTLKSAGETSVKIYSLEGRLVKTLHDGYSPAGTSELHWNGLDNAGRPVPTGVYFLSVQSSGTKAVQKLYLLK